MPHRLCAVLHLAFEAGAARRAARVRFYMPQVELLRRKLGGIRVFPGPNDQARLASGAERDHRIQGVLGIVTPWTMNSGRTSHSVIGREQRTYAVPIRASPIPATNPASADILDLRCT